MNLPSHLRSLAVALLRRTGLYHPVRDWRRHDRFAARMRRELAAWQSAGQPVPPPASIKHAVIRRHARQYHANTLVETGTFYGDTLFALRREFQHLHSIELAPELHALAVRELGHLPHLTLHLGDSATELPRLLPQLAEPVIFWLDGHFCAGPSARGSRDTPVSTEVECLLARPPGNDVILIDDARLFTGRDDYPSLETLRAHFARARPEATFTVEHDIICAAPV